MKHAVMLRILLVGFFLFRQTLAQQKDPALTTLSQAQTAMLVQEVANSQAQLLIDGGKGISYRSHWVDQDDDSTREVIGSSDGRLDRLLTEKGQPLSAERALKERKRLNALSEPAKLRSEVQSSARLLPYFVELVRAMPLAMLYTAAGPQFRLTDVAHPQVILDYSPNPAFQAKTVAESTLKKLSGRLWIDAVDHHLLRMDITIEQDVSVFGGLLIKVFRGGAVEYNQRRVEEGRYSLSRLRLHLRIRELLVKSKSIDAELTASNVRLLSPVPNGPEAIRALLTLPTTSH